MADDPFFAANITFLQSSILRPAEKRGTLMKNHTTKAALRVTVVYTVVAALWIFFSGRLLAFFVHDLDRYVSLEVYKGLGFVAVTSVLLYLGMKYQFGRMEQMHNERLAEVTRRENILHRLEHYLEVSPTVTWAGKLEDGKNRPVWVSENIQHLFGYSPSEILEPDRLEKIVPPEDFKNIQENLSKLREKGQLSQEFRLIKKDGTTIWVREDIRAAGSKNHPEDIVGTWTDITSEKEAKLALAESEERYRSLFEHAPNAIFISIDNRIALANMASVRLFGVNAADDLLGRSIFELFHPDCHDLIKERLELARNTTEALPSVEEKVLRFDGTIVDVEVSTAPFRYDGRQGTHVMVHDITRLKESERKLRELNAELERRVAERTAELEIRNGELETFTYSVSHDLKAPLRGIDGYSRLLLEDHYEHLDEEGRRFLEIIREAALRMSRLIDDLLDYSRMERRPMRTGSVNLRKLIDSTLRERGEEISKKGIDVKISLPFDTVTADGDGVSLALGNFLENAIKFSDPSRGPEIEIGGSENDSSWVIWVRDNGIGFDMSFHDRIFGIFQRLHRSEDYEGTGVGLAIVKKAVERMGGRTWAESTPGEGSTFYMELPK